MRHVLADALQHFVSSRTPHRPAVCRKPDCLQRAQTSAGKRTPWSARMVAAQVNFMPDSTIRSRHGLARDRAG